MFQNSKKYLFLTINLHIPAKNSNASLSKYGSNNSINATDYKSTFAFCKWYDIYQIL